MGDKPYMLSMLRHFDKKHRFFSKSFKSKKGRARIQDSNELEKKELLDRYANDLEGMPALKGANKKSNLNVYKNLTKQKKPSKREAQQMQLGFNQMLLNDELRSDQLEMTHNNAEVNQLAQ